MKNFLIILLTISSAYPIRSQSPYCRLTHQNLVIDPQSYPPKIIQLPLVQQQNASMGGYYCDSLQILTGVYGFINNLTKHISTQESYNLLGYGKDNGVGFYNSSLIKFGDTIVSIVGLNWDNSPKIPNYSQSGIPILKGGEISFYSKDLAIIKTIKLKELTLKTAVYRFSPNAYNLIIVDTGYIYSYILRNSALVLVDSIRKKVFHNGQVLDDGYNFTQFKFSNTGKKLGYLNFSIVSHYNPALDKKISVDSGFLDIIDFEPSTGKFLTEKELFRYQINNYKNRLLTDFVPISYEFSSNDSVLYITHTKDQFKNNKVYYDLFVRQYNLYNPKTFWDFCSIKEHEGVWYSYPYNLFLSPNGKIYLYRNEGTNFYSFYDRNDTFSVIVDEISSPDFLGNNCQFKKNITRIDNIYTNLDSAHINFYTWPSLNFNKVTPIKFSFLMRCRDSMVLFKNESDKLFKKFTWYFSENDSSNTKHPTYKYNIPGKYFIKIRAFYNSTEYIESGDSILIKPEFFKPQSLFSTYSEEGCQFVSFNITNKSKSQFNTVGYPKSYWFFGDGRDSIVEGIKNINTSYDLNGKFKISLITDNGYCKDTFVKIEDINIKAAPKPGIIFVKNPPFCEYSPVIFKREYYDLLDSAVYLYGGKQIAVYNNLIPDTIYPIKGEGYLKQLLFGPTGCVTMDSVKLDVHSGFSLGYSPEIISASVIDKNLIKVKWLYSDSSFNSLLYKDNKMIAELKHVNEYLDKDVNPSEFSYSFYISNKNICGELSDTSSHFNSILLKGIANSNDLSKLDWNNVNHEPSIFEVIKNFPTKIAHHSDVLSFTDFDFANVDYSRSCYIVKYISSLNDSLSSFSNEICLNYFPTLYIPTSFTPNGDNINDNYKIVTYGVRNISFTVYNMWGEILFETESIDGSWDGLYKGHLVPPGSYYVKVHADGPNTIINKGIIIYLDY